MSGGINRGFIAALAAAAAGLGGLGSQYTAPPPGPVAIAGGGHAADPARTLLWVGGLGNTLSGFLTGGGFGTRGGFSYPNQTRKHSVAQGQRNARRRRNILRARGHHRQAVR